MEKKGCIYYPEQPCHAGSCSAVRFLRNCPRIAAPVQERRPPVSVRGGRPAWRGLWLRPAAVWLVVLTTIFAAEYVVMLILPWLLSPAASPILEAAIDAVILIAALAPVLWWTVARPRNEVIRLRARFLADLFARIETDRRATAHELHDGVGQSLSLLVSGLRSACESATDPEDEARCEHLLKLARESLADVKRLALGLRPSLLDDLGLAPALERLAADVRENTPLELTLDVSRVAGRRFPEPVETAAFRIVQEAIGNLVTHSGARTGSVAVGQRAGALTIEVVDDGHGFDPSDDRLEWAGHMGLIGMRQRANLLGGTFAIDSAPGRGTRVTATLPVRE